MRGWAFGILGLTRSEFYHMRPAEFWEAWLAHNEEVMASRRHIGELVRGATLRLVNLQLKQAYQMRDPAKFWRMPWDEEDIELSSLDSMTEQEREAEVEKFNKIFGHGKRKQEHDCECRGEHLGLHEEDEGRTG